MPPCIQRIAKHKCQEMTFVLELGCRPYFISSGVIALLEFSRSQKDDTNMTYLLEVKIPLFL